tara:strand:+ start:421 stop:744 length:324 start_codon:yes stop_codon:yes gene_type:complete
MPYTPDELKELQWYQTFLEADEIRYGQNKLVLLAEAAVSSSLGAADSDSKLIRDDENTILLFENPSKNKIEEDPNSRIFHNTEVKRLKTKEGDSVVMQIIDRRFKEL